MEDNFVRFDMKKPPTRQWPILRDFIKAVSYFALKKHKTKIIRKDVDKLKGPYILLCNHNAFLDFFVAATCVYPRRANYIVAIDGFTMPMGKGFISREGIMRAAGCICKRKFTNDTQLVRQIKRILDNGDVVVLYPEARYSLCGTNAVLPESLGKMCKLYKAGVATLICHGHHANAPFWNTKDKGLNPLEAEFSLLYTAEDIENASVAQINAAINERFRYDDFRWIQEKGIRLTAPDRAKGLHKVLYQCSECGTEYRMDSEGDRLFCRSCGCSWHMDEDGSLRSDRPTRFSHIPDWYEWERENVRAEVESGTYHLDVPMHVSSLPNSKGYIDLGSGRLTHDANGFRAEVSGEFGDFVMEKPVLSLYSCHIEYEYLGKYGDCIDLNTLEDTWYIYPEGEDFSVTKVALATEELYFHAKAKKSAKV